MKTAKSKITCTFLLSFLFLLLTVNISLAADPSDYVGVSAGDTPAWTITMHGAGLKDIAQDMPESQLPFNATNLPSWVSLLSASVNLHTTVSSVSTEGQMALFNGTGVYHVNLTVTGYFKVLNYTSDTSPPITVVILDPDTSNFTYLTAILIYKAMNGIFGGNESADSEKNMMLSALVMPKNISWAPIVSDLNVYLDMINDTMQATVSGNGVSLNIPAYTLNESQKEIIDVEVTYKDSGLLDTATLKYGGKLALSISYGASEIPGYELPIIIGMSAIGVIGLIYSIKRKRKILST